MWSTSATAKTKATREEVFAHYRDVTSWSRWDEAVKDATLNGPFKVGTTGTLRPAGGPPATFTITIAEPGRRFTDVTRLPGAKLTFDHVLQDHPEGGTIITHTVSINGPMTFLFSRVIGRKIAKDLPGAVASLARTAEAAQV